MLVAGLLPTARHHSDQVRRYIEVGVYTAWTCAFVSTYLRRVGRVGSFRGYAVDLTTAALAAGTRSLLPLINVTFLFRKGVVLGTTSTGSVPSSSAAAAPSAQVISSKGASAVELGSIGDERSSGDGWYDFW